MIGKCDVCGKDETFGWDENGNIIITKPDGTIKITPDSLYMIDKYGNVLTMDDVKAIFQQNSSTYDELYEHWLKTKQND